MTRTNESAGRPAPPTVADLFAQFLTQQISAHAEGLGYAEPTGEAVPHEAVPVQPVDPQLAWKDAVVAAKLLHPATGPKWSVPPEWPTLVTQQEPAVALAFCLGNYPQLVRNLHLLLTREPAALREATAPRVTIPAIEQWASQTHDVPTRLLAAGVLRLARQFDRAEELLAQPVSEEWQALHANEVAALAWHRGQPEKALVLWRKAPESAPVLFNRGMASLFLGQDQEAVESLRQATSALPESSAWHHLAQLYLALASVRLAG
jgi:tetratricopeptide (TPR) repeat protein